MQTSPSTTGAQPARGGMEDRRGGRDLGASLVSINGTRAPLADLYHSLLNMSWPRFLCLVVGTYLAANFLFAGVYTLLPGAIADSTGYLDNFFFSVQTWATIGYGGMRPLTVAANMVVVVESLMGIFAVALLTGLFFAKFSRPSARVLFADHVVVARRDGQRVLMIRVANERGSRVVDANAHVTILKDEVTTEGDRMRRILDLHLVRNNTPFFVLSWTILHVIDETSPLFAFDGLSVMESLGVRVAVSLTGFDASVGQTIHASCVYAPDQIRLDHRFVDATSRDELGRTVLDYAKFHRVEPMPPPAG